MNGGILPLLLISATIGLALSFAGRRQAWIGAGAVASAALLTSLFPIAQSGSKIAFAGLWISMIITAAMVYLPRDWPTHWAIPVSAIGGGWAGAVASLSDRRWELVLALPLSLLFMLGRPIVSRGYGVAIKVAASWMIAIAALSLFVSMMPHPGYVPDHME